jgi:hypothetical protein
MDFETITALRYIRPVKEIIASQKGWKFKTWLKGQKILTKLEKTFENGVIYIL